MAEERVQKILARSGYGSRRASEDLIAAGRVRINGQVAELGSKADPQQDTITVDNQALAREQPPVYVAVNKPQGVLSEVSPDESRQTVRDLVPLHGHLFIVGRLDLDSEGLILLTNDGDMANKLTHPRYGHEKEYRVLVGARPDEKQIAAWRHGIVLEDGYRTMPAVMRVEAQAGKGAWLRVILREGRKRQIREMGKMTGLPVLRIQRIRIGTLLLDELKPGQWRQLRPEEVRALKVKKIYQETERPRQRPGAGGPRVRSEGGPRGERSSSDDRPRSGPPGTRFSGDRPRSGPSSARSAYDRPRSGPPGERSSSDDRPRSGPPGTRRPSADRQGPPGRSSRDGSPSREGGPGLRRPSSDRQGPPGGAGRGDAGPGTRRPSSDRRGPPSDSGRSDAGPAARRPSRGRQGPPSGTGSQGGPNRDSSRPPSRGNQGSTGRQNAGTNRPDRPPSGVRQPRRDKPRR